jgi:hypothetical protein
MSVSIATDYGLEFEFRSSQEFSLLRVVQTGSGAYPASCPLGTGALSLGVKRPLLEADHSPPTSGDVKKKRLHGVVLTEAQGQLYLYSCLICEMVSFFRVLYSGLLFCFLYTQGLLTHSPAKPHAGGPSVRNLKDASFRGDKGTTERLC